MAVRQTVADKIRVNGKNIRKNNNDKRFFFCLPVFVRLKCFDKIVIWYFNLLKPTGYVMHQQFNIQQLYALPTLYLCVLYLSENKQRLVPLTAQADWFL